MWPSLTPSDTAPRRTGFVYEELMMWHSGGSVSFDQWTENGEHWENPDTKRRFNSLLEVSGMKYVLKRIPPRKATVEEVARFHTVEYIEKIELLSKAGGGESGQVARFGPGGYDIALLSAGGVLTAVEAVLKSEIDNAYCLVRPPGHHALRDLGMGFCIFNNVVLGALHARALNNPNYRVAIIDYDVHHGNGTEQAFWDDPLTLFISLHQDHNYPRGTGGFQDIGGENARGTNINIPLPPGSGMGCYSYAFDKVVIPALYKFKPDFIFVSSGFDASFADPLASMMLSSDSYREMTAKILKAANDLCGGRAVFCHEGGYSKTYVPFCGLAVVEELCGRRSYVEDPDLTEVKSWGYQECQPHQAAVVDAVAAYLGLGSASTNTTSELPATHVDRVKSSVQVLLDSLSATERAQLLQTLSAKD